MRAIVLGAGRGLSLQPEATTPKCLLEGIAGWRVLDWILNALNEGGGVRDVVFIGGDAIGEVQKAYPDLHYVFNPQWYNQHVVGSLFVEPDELRGPFLFSYSDVVYRPATVQSLMDAPGDIVLTVDRGWRERFVGRSQLLLQDAEKVAAPDGRVLRLGKDLDLDDDIVGEFIGLAKFSERGTQALKQVHEGLSVIYGQREYRGRKNLANAFLSDLIQEMIDQGFEVRTHVIDGGWAELDVPEDLSQFVFGTKAETLERLRPLMRHATIARGTHLQVGQWLNDPAAWAQSLALQFEGQPLAVRSSALAEDQSTTSNAGRYHSVLDVEGGNAVAIAEAVDTVVASYERDGARPDDQILIQPFLADVIMSGVLMTRDLDSGAPYLVVHYDDQSGRTDAVTAGTGESHTVRVARSAAANFAAEQGSAFAPLIAAVSELEAMTGSDTLDVEFAIDREQQLHVLQVRPIAARAGWTNLEPRAHDDELQRVRAFLEQRLSGAATIFGQMPDWNPAEMIGAFPDPLARSLYESLITDTTWRRARARLGYTDPGPHPLLVELAGRPYVDVRLSVTNLLPATLDIEVRERIADAAIATLRAKPHLHDKIEFDVLATCFDFDLSRALDQLEAHGLPKDDRRPYEDALTTLTMRILLNANESLAWAENAHATLQDRVDSLMGDTITDRAQRIAQLHESTIELGTLPFAVNARLAFVGTSLLRSLRRKDLLSGEQWDAFFASTSTITTEFVQALNGARNDDDARRGFLARFGHLRPGSYDIRSPRYDQAPEAYLNGQATTGEDTLPFELDESQHAAIDRLLRRHGLPVDSHGLFSFVRTAVAAREASKFAFSRALSGMLELIAEWAEQLGLSREEAAMLEISDVLAWKARPAPRNLDSRLLRLVADRRLHRQVQARVSLPILIRDAASVDWFEEDQARPNFVTQRRVRGAPLRLDANTPSEDLDGRIVVIEGADPGYDWIFGHRIAGLMTRFGGANSHMTIRCAEFGIPAAIGCGQVLFQRAKKANLLELDCQGESIRVLE